MVAKPKGPFKKTEPVEEPPVRTEIESFFTKETSERGIKLPLETPDGKLTEHWLKVYGIDSDQFKLAFASYSREVAAIAANEKLTVDQKFVARSNLKNELIAALIPEWSFDRECSFENRVEFLTKAPQICETVDVVVSDRKLFFALRSTD